MNENGKNAVASEELADFCIKCAEDKIASDAVKLYVGSRSSVADYYVICTVNSEPQMRAVVSFIERQVREVYQKRPLSADNGLSSSWQLIDFGTVIVHVMTQEIRDRYNLEGLWGETPDAGALNTLEAHR